MLGKRNWFTRKKLEEHGSAAPATVLEIADSGMTVTHGGDDYVGNTEVILKTRLRVEPPGRPAFEVEQKFRYPQLSIPSAGSVLQVRFDEDDHDKVMIDTAALPVIPASFGAGSGIDFNGLLTTVREQKAAGADRAAMGDALRQQLGVQMIDLRPAGSEESVRIAQLERLAALHAQGVLTDAEFAAQKAIVLSDPA